MENICFSRFQDLFLHICNVIFSCFQVQRFTFGWHILLSQCHCSWFGYYLQYNLDDRCKGNKCLFHFSKLYYSQLLVTAICLKRIFLFRRLKEQENYFIMCIYNLTILREKIKISSSSPFVIGLLRWTLRKKFESDFNKLGEFPIN